MPFDSEILTRKLGPLPTWVWAIIGLGVAYVGYKYVGKSSSATPATTPATTPDPGATPDTSSTDPTIPTDTSYSPATNPTDSSGIGYGSTGAGYSSPYPQYDYSSANSPAYDPNAADPYQAILDYISSLGSNPNSPVASNVPSDQVTSSDTGSKTATVGGRPATPAKKTQQAATAHAKAQTAHTAAAKATTTKKTQQTTAKATTQTQREQQSRAVAAQLAAARAKAAADKKRAQEQAAAAARKAHTPPNKFGPTVRVRA